MTVEHCNMKFKHYNMTFKHCDMKLKHCNMTFKHCNIIFKHCNIEAAIAFSNPNFNHFYIENTKTQPLKSAPLSFWHYIKLKIMPKWRGTGKFD